MSALKDAVAHSETLIGTEVGVSDWITVDQTMIDDFAKTTHDLLHILGDQEDHPWPIFHDQVSHKAGDLSDWTMCTVLVDLRAKVLRIFEGNPRLGKVVAEERLRLSL